MWYCQKPQIVPNIRINYLSILGHFVGFALFNFFEFPIFPNFEGSGNLEIVLYSACAAGCHVVFWIKAWSVDMVALGPWRMQRWRFPEGSWNLKVDGWPGVWMMQEAVAKLPPGGPSLHLREQVGLLLSTYLVEKSDMSEPVERVKCLVKSWVLPLFQIRRRCSTQQTTSNRTVRARSAALTLSVGLPGLSTIEHNKIIYLYVCYG